MRFSENRKKIMTVYASSKHYLHDANNAAEGQTSGKDHKNTIFNNRNVLKHFSMLVTSLDTWQERKG